MGSILLKSCADCSLSMTKDFTLLRILVSEWYSYVSLPMSNLEGGKTMSEILASPLMLEGVVGEGQRLMTMDPVERQAVKNAQIAEDFSMMDTDFMTPAKQGLEAVDVDMVNERANREIEKRRKAKAVQRNKTLPNQGLLRILANPTYEGVL